VAGFFLTKKSSAAAGKKVFAAWIPAIVVLCAAFLAPFAAPHNPNDISLDNTLVPPSAEYVLGTDELGRCIFSRLLEGGRTTVGAALLIELTLVFLGTLLGTYAGFSGGIFDTVLLVIIDILFAFPSLILALVIAGWLGAGLRNLMLAMSLVYWVEHARIARSMACELREKEFVLAARALGCPPSVIIGRHIIPQIIPVMTVHATLHITQLIIGISSLSFLGLGVRPPAPEWGALLAEQRNFLRENPAALCAILLCIVLSAAAFQISGEISRDRLNPRISCL
jgi:ABC-type dipeptide/oligopeptide/nickel transport system permease subunit